MKIVKELMEVYSNFVDLPLLLINDEGEIEYSVNYYEISGFPPKDNLFELKNMANSLSQSIIMSVSNNQSSNFFYILTPTFFVGGQRKFLAAGPFFIENTIVLSCPNNNIKIFPKEQLDDKLHRLKNLHLLLVNKAKVELNNTPFNEIMSVFSWLKEIHSYFQNMEEFNEELVKRLLVIEAFDFLGYARKNEHDIYDVQYIKGSQVEHLQNKQFYIGEGLLGKAAILKKDFYWSKGIDIQHNEFFQRYNIYPNHLFGLLANEEADIIVFGGNFNEDVVHEVLLHYVKCIAEFVYQQHQMSYEYQHTKRIQEIFTNGIDLLEVSSCSNMKNISHKLLDFCYTLNNHHYVCFSYIDGQFFERAIQEDIVIKHESSKQHDEKFSIEKNLLHFKISFGNQLCYYTVTFEDTQQALQAQVSLKNMVFYIERLYLSNDNCNLIKQPSIFQLLNQSMEIMNSEKYEQSQFAVQLVEHLHKYKPLQEEEKIQLLNICDVLPYDFTFLEQYIRHTVEWKLISQIQPDQPANIENLPNTIQMLNFIYRVCMQKNFTIAQQEYPHFYKLYMSLINNLQQKEIVHHEQPALNNVKKVIEHLAITPREKEVLSLILEGMNNFEIGNKLKISVHTVKNHVTNIFKKLNVTDRVQVMTKVYKMKP